MRDAWCADRKVQVLRYPAAALSADLDAVVRQIMAIAIERRDGVATRSPPAPSVSLRLPPPPGGGG